MEKFLLPWTIQAIVYFFRICVKSQVGSWLLRRHPLSQAIDAVRQEFPSLFARGPHKLLHIEQLQQFEGQTSYVVWLFRDMLHSTKSTNVSQIYYFFIVEKMSLLPDKMFLRAGWNGFVGRIRGPLQWRKKVAFLHCRAICERRKIFTATNIRITHLEILLFSNIEK